MITSPELLEAERIMLECAERHIDCVRCSSQAKCRKAWDELIEHGSDGYTASVAHVMRFKQRISRYESDANKQLEPVGAMCFAAGVIYCVSFFWGAVL